MEVAMYVCNEDKVCNTVHEPDCLRGGKVTAASVTGTGPGAACKPPRKPPTPPPGPPKKECSISVKIGNTVRYRVSSGNSSIKGC